MSLLTRPQRRQLEELLMRLPNINGAASRNLLLADLPRDLTRTIEFDAAAGTHVANIVSVANDDTWARLPDGTVPLLLVIENAIDMVRGSGLAAELQKFHDTIQSVPPPGDGTSRHTVSTTTPSAQAPPQASSTISLTNLTGLQRRQLHNALLSAFPTMADLQQMVAFGLDGALTRMAGGNLSDMTLSLMTWAQAHGRMEDLVKAALAENPTNPDLRAFAQAAGLPV